MSDQDLEGSVRDVVAAAVAPLGLVVDDLRVTRAGKRRLVRVAVDDDLSGLTESDERTPVPPIALDTVADATRVVDAALDGSDVMGEAPYVLEVTSPGISRPLTDPRHFRRNVGRLVQLESAEGGPRIEGRIVAAGADGVLLSIPPAKGTQRDPQERLVPYAQVARGNVQVEFTKGPDDFADDADAADAADAADDR